MLRDLVGGDFSQAVASRDDAKGAIGGRSFVEVNSDRDHFFQEGDRRLDVDCFLFDGPRAVALNVTFFDNGNGEVLMPGHRPVLIGSLVEEDASHEAMV